MTDTVVINVTMVLQFFVVALAVVVFYWLHQRFRQTHDQLTELHLSVNSRLTELLKSVSVQMHSQGLAEGRELQRDENRERGGGE